MRSNGNPRSQVQLALIPIARTTFDIPLAEEVTSIVKAQLTRAGLDFYAPDHLITTQDEAAVAASQLRANPPDLLLILQSTFADSTMAMTLTQAVVPQVPILLWAVPEAHTGGRLRLNSLCGINLAGHALTRIQRSYETIFAAPDDEAALEKVTALAMASMVKNRLQSARVGRVGEHPDGFDTCKFDADRLKQVFGLDIVQINLPEFFDQVRVADQSEVKAETKNVQESLANLSDMEPVATQGTISTYVTLQEIAKTQSLHGFAMRCWPEFFTELGCAACGAMSMMSNAHTPCSCEVDVNGTITSLILQWLSGEPAFGSDLVSVDDTLDAIVLWHCGLAPQSMADPATSPLGTIHSNRKLPLLLEFPLKPGRVTIARLSEATGTFRLVVGGGEMIQVPLVSQEHRGCCDLIARPMMSLIPFWARD
jgi:L-fucose isomerase-like protein